MAKSGPFGFAADQANKRQIAFFSLTLEACSHHIQILGVREAHDEHMAVGRQIAHRRLHGR